MMSDDKNNDKNSERVKVKVNGEDKDFDAPLTMFTLLEQEGVIDMMIGAAQNGAIVPRSVWDETTIKLGDIIEIVSPQQGG